MKPIALLLLLMAPAACALTVRVESTEGSPRIVVDGKPVRARMFFGAPGTAPIPVASEWQEAGFDFTASGDADNGTMHFRFGPQSGEVELRDIRLDGEDPGGWTVWPPGMAGAVSRSDGTIQVRIPPPPNGQRPDFHIYSQPRLVIRRGQRYHVTFRARATPGRPLTVAIYRPGEHYVRLGAPGDVFDSQLKLAAGAGVDFVSFPVGLPCPKPGQPADWAAEVDAACETVLSANPNALLLPRIPMDPPPWWREAHPGEVM
ncbi:MAG: hypothetical protein K9M97_14220, partial [Akkermansiaceae bacterium]|nr:hypothetical protein [Akkermansiaceae bacterium]